MRVLLSIRPRTADVAKNLVRSLVALALLGASMAAWADCVNEPDPEIRQLHALADKDSARAVKAVQSRLDGLANAHSPEELRRVASLYAAQAHGYTVLELDGEARKAASNGPQLAPDTNDPLHLYLMTMYALNVYDSTGINSEANIIAAARASQSPGTAANVCLQIALGILQLRQDRSDLAIQNLTQAYGVSTAPELAEQHVQAASALSSVMLSLGDFAQALALNQEVVDWDRARGADLSLSVSMFLRGEILTSMHRYSEAVEQFGQARKISVQLGDKQGIAFADLRICDAEISVGELGTARRDCENARSVFAASDSTDVLKESQAFLARIDLAEGYADRALVTMNQVLDKGGADMPPRRIAFMYQVRAEANAALHNYREAYADLDEYQRRYVAENDAERGRQAAVLRARFEIDREIERNAALQQKLTLAREHSERQKEQLRWTAIASTACALIIALLTYILIANLRHRRQLIRLADHDSLTGLPNRRRTVELATSALAHAASTSKPLTLALIDFDHFKMINDRCGHACGDHVLKEFARIGRQSIRSSDVLGRWGGEEFLLVLPNTTLDTSFATVERLRELALDIQLLPTASGLRVSLSAGLASSAGEEESLDDLVARADAALYEAKGDGRDLVRVADEGGRKVSTGVRKRARS